MVKPFTMQGRITRQQYIITTLVIFVAAMGLSAVIGFAAGMAGMSEAAASATGFVVGAMASVAQALLMVRRLHDLGKPGWHFWLFFIPLYNLYLGIVLLFTPGEKSSNIYGPATCSA